MVIVAEYQIFHDFSLIFNYLYRFLSFFSDFIRFFVIFFDLFLFYPHNLIVFI